MTAFTKGYLLGCATGFALSFLICRLVLEPVDMSGFATLLNTFEFEGIRYGRYLSPDGSIFVMVIG